METTIKSGELLSMYMLTNEVHLETTVVGIYSSYNKAYKHCKEIYDETLSMSDQFNGDGSTIWESTAGGPVKYCKITIQKIECEVDAPCDIEL